MVDPKNDVQTERAFLHAIASPLSAVHIHLSGILEDFEARAGGLSDAETDLSERVRFSLEAVERITSLVQRRRSVILSAEPPKA